MMLRLPVLLMSLLIASGAQAAVIWNEAVNGDFSGDRFNPTALTVSLGSNQILATTGDSELDFYTIHLDAGEQLSQIIVNAYGNQDTSFIGMTTGTTFSVDPDMPDITALLGWTHFGPTNVGSDILPIMGSGFLGSQIFTGPLPAGDYSFWMNQFNEPTPYTLDFVVPPVPEPATMAALGLGVAAMLRRRKR